MEGGSAGKMSRLTGRPLNRHDYCMTSRSVISVLSCCAAHRSAWLGSGLLHYGQTDETALH